MKALFLGIFSFQTAAAMSAWLGDGHEIVGFWHPRSESGRRDRVLRFMAPPWSVTALLSRHRIPATAVARLSQWEQGAAMAAATGADVIVSAFFSQIVPPSMVERFPGRIVNVHPALLPRYRGPHPTLGMLVDRTVDEAAGATLHVLTEGIDEGAIISQKPVAFPADADMMRFRIGIAQATADMVRTIPAYIRREVVPVPQDEGLASYRKVDLDRDLVIGPRRTAEEAAWLCATVPPMWPLRAAAEGAPRVRAPCRVVGPPTGAAPVVRPLWVECDVAESRVRVRRQTFLWRRLQRWRFYARLRRTALHSAA